MASLTELVIAKLNLHLSSKNKTIIKQINKYEEKRNKVWIAEHKLSILADALAKDSLDKSADLLKKEADTYRIEIERLEKNIADLISKLEPDAE